MVLLVAACGGDDAAGVVDAGARDDASVGADAGLPVCDHTELDDDANDTAGEVTGLTTSDPIAICGRIDAREPDSEGHVDVDRYAFAVADAGDFLVRVDSADGRDVDLLTATVALAAGADPERGHGQFVGNHLVLFATLEAGAMIVDVVAFHGDTPDAAIDYVLRVVPDDGEVRCAPDSEPLAYTEAADGVDSRGNDMAEVVYQPAFAVTATASADDTPEPAASRATVTAGMKYRIGGTAADVTSPGDDYRDRDTYLIATGANTNELTVRVTSPAGADLDFLIMPVPTAGADPIAIFDGTQIGTTGTELQTGAVLPSTSYWLWVGGYDDTGVTWPKAYVIALCGASY